MTMTNREWLETLTDEELIKLLYDKDDSISCDVCSRRSPKLECTPYCKDGMKEWLNQQHKEKEDD